MSILVLGATGLIGNRLVRTLSEDFDVFGTTRQLKFSNQKFYQLLKKENWLINTDPKKMFEIEAKIKKLKPNVIVNCLGITKQKAEAFDLQECVTVNALFPHQLSTICRELDIRLIHLSTDCVFSGQKGNYTEDDIPDPIDTYGRTKVLGDLLNTQDLTIRTSFVGREISSFMNLFEWAIRNKNKKIQAYPNAIYSGLTTLTLSQIIKTIIVEHPTLFGLWHISSEPVSKYELLSNLNKELALKIDIQKDESFICDRSLNSDSFRKKTLIKIPNWSEMIKEFIDDQSWYDKLVNSDLSHS
jgi:dTDP-4-dehydrorhamnose reductase